MQDEGEAGIQNNTPRKTISAAIASSLIGYNSYNSPDYSIAVCLSDSFRQDENRA